jgi:hypothetical protein
VQVDFVLDPPMPAAQLAQQVGGMPGTQERERPAALSLQAASPSRYFSASSAAMQPLPALVTACR